MEASQVLTRRRQWPNLNLLSTMLDHCLLLVKTCEASIHPLIEAPRLAHWDVQLVCILKSKVACLDCTLQNRCECHIALEALRFQKLARILGLSDTLLAKINIYPAGKNVRHIPL